MAAGARSAGGALVVERLLQPDAEDVSALARLLPQLSSSAAPLDLPTLAAVCAAPGTHLLVARRAGDKTVLGTLSLVVFRLITGTRSLIEDVVVDESARGAGIGMALIDHALAVAAAEGARDVDLTSRPSREAANRLYARAGFVQRDTNVWRYRFGG